MKDILWDLILLSAPTVMLYFLWSELNHLRLELSQLKPWVQIHTEMGKDLRKTQMRVMELRLEELKLRKAKRLAKDAFKQDAIRYQVSPLKHDPS